MSLFSVYSRYQQISDKAVNNYPHALEFVPDCYMTQTMCDKAVNTHSYTMQFVPESHKTQILQSLW